MTAPVIVANPFGAQIVALSAELVERSALLCAQADTVRITDPASLAQAESLFVTVDKFCKTVAADRLALTRQIDTLKKAIMGAEEQATTPLLARRVTIAKAIAEFRDKLAAEERERQRLAREQAEREAAELRRQQEEQRKADLAAYEAKKAAAQKQADEEAALFGTPAKPAEVAPPPAPVPPPVVAVVDQPAPGPSLGKSPVRTQNRWRTVIYDRDALFAEAIRGHGMIHGRPVLLIDETAIDRLLHAGCPVPGAKREPYQVVGSAGAR